MDTEGHHQDDPIMVTMFEGLTDCDNLWEERNTLAVALRKIARLMDFDPCAHLTDEEDEIIKLCDAALRAVFPEDPLGEKAIYDCPAADGRNRLREEADHGAD